MPGLRLAAADPASAEYLAEKIAQTELSSGENQLQIMNLKNQQLSDVTKDLRDMQTKRFDLLDRLKGARDVMSRLTISAPVSGRIVELSVHTKGAVIKPPPVQQPVPTTNQGGKK